MLEQMSESRTLGMDAPETRAATPHRELSRLLLALILCLSALVQLTVVARTEVSHPLQSDAGDYFSYAYNLRHHGVYSASRTWQADSESTTFVPDKMRPPGYPLMLAMIGIPEPTSTYLRRASLVQALLGTLSVWLIYLLSARFLGRNWALASAALTAFNPHLATISTYLLTESLFFFLLLAGILTLQNALASGDRWRYAASGVFWGLCSLTRPTTAFLPIVLLVVVVVIPSLRRFRGPALAAFAGFAIVLSPWLLRNQSSAVQEGPDLMVNTLLHGSYPNFMYEGRSESLGIPYRFDPDTAKRSRDVPTVLRHIATQFWSEPVTYLKWYLIGKPIFFLSWGEVKGQGWEILIYPVEHSPYYEDARFAVIRRLSRALHWPLMILGLAGAICVALRPRSLLLDRASAAAANVVVIVVAYAIAFHMIAAPFPRYGIPFRPLLFALAILLLKAVWIRWRITRRPRFAQSTTASS